MKSFKSLMLLFALLNMNINFASEVISQQLVCHPDLTIAVNSFGKYIKTQEIKIFPGYADRAIKAQMLLLRWMQNATPEGHLLRDRPSENLFWQFVETKQYIGMILIIPNSDLDPRFYKTLGSGGSVEGKYLYGYSVVKNSQEEIMSFVIDKQSLKLVHFENWMFMHECAKTDWNNTTISKNLLTTKELILISPDYFNHLVSSNIAQTDQEITVLIDNTKLFQANHPEKFEKNYQVELSDLHVS